MASGRSATIRALSRALASALTAAAEHQTCKALQKGPLLSKGGGPSGTWAGAKLSCLTSATCCPSLLCRGLASSTTTTLADEVVPTLGLHGTSPAAEKTEPSMWQEPENKFPSGGGRGPSAWTSVPLWAKALMAWGAVSAVGVAVSLLLKLFSSPDAGEPADRLLADPPIEGVKAQLLEFLTHAETLLIKLVASSLVAKLLLILLAGVPFILLFGTLYSRLTGTPIKKALLRCYALINRLPGCGSVIAEDSLAAAVLINFMYFLGMFTFVTFIGFVTQDVREIYAQVQGGLYPVQKVGHTVLLFWNEHTYNLLQSLAQGRRLSANNPFFNRPVAILSDRPKAEMDAELKDIDLEVHTRRGSPLVVKDLKMVAADKASTVLIMQPASEGTHSSSTATQNCVAAAAMAVSSLRPEAKGPPQRLLLQSPMLRQSLPYADAVADPGALMSSATAMVGAAAGASGGMVQTVKLERVDVAPRFAVMATLQPGIVDLYKQVLAPGGATLGAQPLSAQLAGASYQKVRRSFDKAIICGFVRDGQVHMVPSDTEVMQEHDRLVTLGLRFEPAPVSQEAEATFQAAAGSGRSPGLYYAASPRRIIVILMGKDTKQMLDLMHDLDQFAPKGSHAVFIVPASSERDPQLVPQSGNCKFKIVWASDENPASKQALIQAGIKTAHSLLVAGLAQMSDADADAFVMATVMQAQDAACSVGRSDAPHFVARVRRPSTETAINNFLDVYRRALPPKHATRVIAHPDLMESNQLVASILAQAACDPDYLPIVTHLLDSSEGAEMYLRDPRAYGCPLNDDTPIAFAALAERARLYNETLIGYRLLQDGKDVLCPTPTHLLPALQRGDKLIVFAEEFHVKPPADALAEEPAEPTDGQF